MRPGWHPLVGCLVPIFIWQAAGDTITIKAGSSVIQTTSGVASLQPLGVSIRLTQYDLPASTLYYLPAGRPRSKKAVNQSRPLAHGYVPTRTDGRPIAGYTSGVWPQEDAVHTVLLCLQVPCTSPALSAASMTQCVMLCLIQVPCRLEAPLLSCSNITVQ